MRKAKEIDQRILSELLKNSKISDRSLAQKLGVSQPTVTRRRMILEKTAIDNYTLVPKWDQIGYEMLAITFIKLRLSATTEKNYEAVRERGMKWLMQQPNIIMGGASRGMDADAFSISIHKSYAEYDTWGRKFRGEFGDLLEDVQSVLVNLHGGEIIKPLNFKYISEIT